MDEQELFSFEVKPVSAIGNERRSPRWCMTDEGECHLLFWDKIQFARLLVRFGTWYWIKKGRIVSELGVACDLRQLQTSSLVHEYVYQAFRLHFDAKKATSPEACFA
jgi:hypothetical protein